MTNFKISYQRANELSKMPQNLLQVREYWGRHFLPESVKKMIVDDYQKKKLDLEGLSNVSLWTYDHVCELLLELEERLPKMFAISGDRKSVANLIMYRKSTVYISMDWLASEFQKMESYIEENLYKLWTNSYEEKWRGVWHHNLIPSYIPFIHEHVWPLYKTI